MEIASSDEALLLNAIKDGEVFPVLGAGASATCLSSNGEFVLQGGALARLMTEKAGYEYHDESLSEVLSATVPSRISKEQFHNIIRLNYMRVSPSEELAALFSFTWRRVYTWNVDDAIENIKSGVQRRHFFNGMADKVVLHQGLEYLQIIHLHGEAMKAEHGLIFTQQEYNSRLNANIHDWYRELASDYASYTPVFIGSRLIEPILSAELDRARPNADAGLGLAFLVTPDNFSELSLASFRAKNIVVVRANLKEFVAWLKSKTNKGVTPLDVAFRVNAFARELSNRFEISLSDVDTARSITLRTWKEHKRDLDALSHDEVARRAREFFEGSPPSWLLCSTNIPVWLQATHDLYNNLEESIARKDRLFLVYGQSGSGKTTGLMQSLNRLIKENGSYIYELSDDTKSLRGSLQLINRLHPEKHVVIYAKDAFVFGDSLLDDLLTLPSGAVTLVTSARSGEWKQHIHRRVGDAATPFEFQRFLEPDYLPLIDRIIKYVPAPKFMKLSSAGKLKSLRQSRSQLLIALKEVTESAKFTSVITKEYSGLPNADCRFLFLVAGVATLARTGISTAALREIYTKAARAYPFDEALRILEGLIVSTTTKRVGARHELYVRHIIENVADFSAIIEGITAMLGIYTKYRIPVVKNVSRLDALLFKFLLNHNFLAGLAKRRGDFESGLKVYQEFEIAFQLDGHFWLQYGQYLVEMGKLEDGVSMLGKSIQAYPGNPFAVHALADVQLRVAARRPDYDSIAIELIGDAVKTLEELDARKNVEFDQYPLVTLANFHIGALVSLGELGQAHLFAREYFNRLGRLSARVHIDEVEKARENLLMFTTTDTWSFSPGGSPQAKKGGPRKHRGAR